MTYCQFVQERKEKSERGVKADQSVTLYTSVKNNGVKRTGLMFSEQGINVAPAIYLESFMKIIKRDSGWRMWLMKFLCCMEK